MACMAEVEALPMRLAQATEDGMRGGHRFRGDPAQCPAEAFDAEFGLDRGWQRHVPLPLRDEPPPQERTESDSTNRGAIKG